MKKRRNAKRSVLSRRTVLGGAGVAVALPFLESMLPRWSGLGKKAKAADDAVRLMWVHVPNGMIRTNMTPGREGADYPMTPLLRDIEDMREHFLVLTGLNNRVAYGRYTYPDGRESNDGPGDHARDAATFLTCTRAQKSGGIRNGISADQEAASFLRGETAISSLVMATQGGDYGGDSGYAPIYKSNISWRSETEPAEKQASAQAIFDDLFAGFDAAESEAQRVARVARDQSVLDAVLGDARSLRGQLSAADNIKLEQYFEGVRSLEMRIASSGTMPACNAGMRPGNNGDGQDERAELLMDLAVTAFECDRTRIASLMFWGGYGFLGVGGGHHSISHLDSGDSDVRNIETINRWQIGQFGRLLRRLQAATLGDGSNLLDRTLVLFGGNIDGTGHGSGDALGDLTPRRSGSVHRHNNLPLLLGGHGGGAVRSGRHIVFDEVPLPNLHMTMLHAIGHRVDRFGVEGTEPLDLT